MVIDTTVVNAEYACYIDSVWARHTIETVGTVDSRVVAIEVGGVMQHLHLLLAQRFEVGEGLTILYNVFHL